MVTRRRGLALMQLPLAGLVRLLVVGLEHLRSQRPLEQADLAQKQALVALAEDSVAAVVLAECLVHL